MGEEVVENVLRRGGVEGWVPLGEVGKAFMIVLLAMMDRKNRKVARGLTDPLIVRERHRKLLAQCGSLVHPALGCAWL